MHYPEQLFSRWLKMKEKKEGKEGERKGGERREYAAVNWHLDEDEWRESQGLEGHERRAGCSIKREKRKERMLMRESRACMVAFKRARERVWEKNVKKKCLEGGSGGKGRRKMVGYTTLVYGRVVSQSRCTATSDEYQWGKSHPSRFTIFFRSPFENERTRNAEKEGLADACLRRDWLKTRPPPPAIQLGTYVGVQHRIDEKFLYYAQE